MKWINDLLESPDIAKPFMALMLAFGLSISLEQVQHGSEIILLIGRYLTGIAMICAALIMLFKSFKNLKNDGKN